MSHFFSQKSHSNVQKPPRNSTIIAPLVKFSCSLTYQGSTTGSQWTHYSRNDLELVIQEVQVGSLQGQDERHLVMKVVAGAEYLEEQDLGEIARISKNFIPSPGIEMPVRVVVKPPLLALRYPKFHDVRRLQFRFRDDAGFSQIVNILTSLGLTTTESLSSGPALQSRPSAVNSTSSGISMVPLTPTTSYPTSSQNTEFKVPMRPESASSILQRSSSPYTSRSVNLPSSRPQSAMSKSSFMPQSKPSIESLKRAQTLYVCELKESQKAPSSDFVAPSPKNISLSHATSENRVLLPTSEESQPCFSVSPFFKPQTEADLHNGLNSSSSVSGSNNYNNIEHGALPDSFDSPENRPLSRPAEYLTFSALEKRPISLPSEHDIYFGLRIPPKRPLPFSTAKVSLNLTSSTPEDATSNFQAANERKRLLERTFDDNALNEISTPTKKPTKRRIASRKGITHLPEVIGPQTKILRSSKLPAANDGLGVSFPTEEPSSLAAESLVIPTASGLPSKQQSKGVTPRQLRVLPPSINLKAPKMVDRSTQTQTLSGRDHTTALKPTQSASTVEASSNLSTPFEPPQVLEKDLDLFLSTYSARSRVSLPSNYNDVPDDVRHKMLNDFIIQNLENEDFLKLAEDMDASWRRMGLTRD